MKRREEKEKEMLVVMDTVRKQRARGRWMKGKDDKIKRKKRVANKDNNIRDQR